jgi:hypothetical protein
MKTYKSCVIITLLGGVLSLLYFGSRVATANPYAENGAISNKHSASTNEIAPGPNTLLTNESNELYKTIVNTDLGTYAVADTNQEIVSLKSKAGQVIWSTNLFLALQDDQFIRGAPKIRGMRVYRGDLAVDVGSRSTVAIIDVKTGKLKGTGSD